MKSLPVLYLFLGLWFCGVVQSGIVSEVEDVLSAGANYLRNKVEAQPHKQSLAAFHDFMSVHNKSYSSKEEYKKRYNIFRNNMKIVEKLQAMELGSAVYGATHLADLTQEEFKRNFLGYTRNDGDGDDIHWPPADIPDIALPDSWDWRDHGAVTEVKNQGRRILLSNEVNY